MFGFKICKVQGQSMAPIVPDGSFVLVNHWLNRLPIKTGQQLLIKHPEFGDIIKTVAVIDHNGLIWSRGENAASVSVEQIGPVNKSQVISRVLHVFKA